MAESNDGGYIDRMFRLKPRLDGRIIKSLNTDEQGRVFIQPETERIERVVQKIACGLFALRYGVGWQMKDFTPVLAHHSLMEIPQRFIAGMHYWPGIRKKRWTVVQPNAFAFLFARGWEASDPPLWCFMELSNTIFAAVACPQPFRRSDRVLKAKAW